MAHGPLETGPINKIVQRKPFFAVQGALKEYLEFHGRHTALPVTYEDLRRYDGLMPLLDKNGKETLWNSVIYRPHEVQSLHEQLVQTYQLLIADGRRIDHLRVASIDFCAYGNSQPFRIKILNQINDNHDYYYIKRNDASRIYGLELEHLLSPNRITYMCQGDTLVEEHIIGVPGDTFMEDPSRYGGHLNQVRLSKEFVKFNERCFVRLLGDMRAYNFVVDVIHDLDQVQYRLRSIDFDQQSYEGRARIYLPQFYKENLPYVQFAQEVISTETAEQYQSEERSLLRKRMRLTKERLDPLLDAMRADRISSAEKTKKLASDLAEYHHDESMRACSSMGEVLSRHLTILLG
ncbi:MAG: hypothetical protein KDC00_08720 [Flavobacteriales bacterium]|nr:hypothetical protein [Flavobacteriales bacterium]